MDIKKTDSADLEHGRLMWFLLALIFILSVFYVTLEWHTTEEIADVDDHLLDDIVRDMEINTAIPMQQTMAIPVKKKQQVADKLKVVDNTTEVRMEGTEQQEDMTDDAPATDIPEGMTATGDEVVTSAIAPPNSNPLNFRVVSDLPQYPGGAVEFMKWLTKNLKYPPQAQRKKIEGKVMAQFIVNTDGSVSDLKIVKSLDPDCDREALRVLRMMPKWKAGMQDGKPCRTMVAIPIVFKL